MIQQSTPKYLPNIFENLSSHTNLHSNVYTGFIYNLQKLKAIKMYFNTLIDKLWYTHTVEYRSAIIRYQLSNCGKMRINHKCLFLHKRNQSEKTTVLFHYISLSGKLKSIEKINKAVVDRRAGRRES